MKNQSSGLRKWLSVLRQYNIFTRLFFYHRIFKVFLWSSYTHFACIVKGGYICTYIYFYSLPRYFDVSFFFFFFNKTCIMSSCSRDPFLCRLPVMATPSRQHCNSRLPTPKFYNWHDVRFLFWISQVSPDGGLSQRRGHIYYFSLSSSLSLFLVKQKPEGERNFKTKQQKIKIK